MNNFKKNFWTVGLSIILVAIVSIYIYKDLNKSNIKPPVQAGESKNEPVSVDLGKSGEGYKVDVEGIKSKPLAIKPPAFGDLVVNSTGLDVVAFEII